MEKDQLDRFLQDLGTQLISEEELVEFLKAPMKYQNLINTIDKLQQSFDNLRVSVKYLVFDLEATRRERDYFMNLIEESEEGDETIG